MYDSRLVPRHHYSLASPNLRPQLLVVLFPRQQLGQCKLTKPYLPNSCLFSKPDTLHTNLLTHSPSDISSLYIGYSSVLQKLLARRARYTHYTHTQIGDRQTQSQKKYTALSALFFILQSVKSAMYMYMHMHMHAECTHLTSIKLTLQ